MTKDLETELGRAAAALSAREIDLASLAAAERLLDVAYSTFESQLGDLLLATTRDGLVRVAYIDRSEADAVLAELASRVSPRLLRARAPLTEACRQLDHYLAGRLVDFDLPLDWRLIGPFARRVLGRTAAIPYGEVATYGEVARSIGTPRAARAAGNALARNPIPIVIPCHRVVPGAGGVGGYGGGSDRKRFLLSLERGA